MQGGELGGVGLKFVRVFERLPARGEISATRDFDSRILEYHCTRSVYIMCTHSIYLRCKDWNMERPRYSYNVWVVCSHHPNA